MDFEIILYGQNDINEVCRMNIKKSHIAGLKGCSACFRHISSLKKN